MGSLAVTRGLPRCWSEKLSSLCCRLLKVREVQKRIAGRFQLNKDFVEDVKICKVVCCAWRRRSKRSASANETEICQDSTSRASYSLPSKFDGVSSITATMCIFAPCMKVIAGTAELLREWSIERPRFALKCSRIK